jgi:hypothetical protein
MYYIVSGSAAVLTRVKRNANPKQLLFSHVEAYGVAVLEVWKSGKVLTKFTT